MSRHFSGPHKHFGRNVKVESDLYSYATKADLKGKTGVKTSNLAAKLNLASLRAEVDRID